MFRSALVFAFCLLITLPARASSEDELPYSIDAVWNTTIRLVRVDLGLEIVDRDKEAGYLMFKYRDGNRFYPASFEIVAQAEQGTVKARASIEGMPSYLERVLLDKLQAKLKQEYGTPMQRKKESPPPVAPAPGEQPQTPTKSADE